MQQPASGRVLVPAAAAQAAAPSLLTDYLPIAVLTDSYKTTHYLQYPSCSKMVAVGAELQWLCPHRACAAQRECWQLYFKPST
jgi:hypothetical protein